MDGRQQLSDWIARHTKPASFARAVGISHAHLHLVLKGERGVSLSVAKRIRDATRGAIPMDALVSEEMP